MKETKIKIVYVFWALGIGGIETMLVNIANALVELGAVHIILINELYEKSLLDKLLSQVKVHFLHRKIGSTDLRFIWRFKLELKSINPDKIYLHGPDFYAMFFYRKFRRKVSLALHALPVSPVRHGSLLRSFVVRLTFGFK